MPAKTPKPAVKKVAARRTALTTRPVKKAQKAPTKSSPPRSAARKSTPTGAKSPRTSAVRSTTTPARKRSSATSARQVEKRAATKAAVPKRAPVTAKGVAKKAPLRPTKRRPDKTAEKIPSKGAAEKRVAPTATSRETPSAASVVEKTTAARRPAPSAAVKPAPQPLTPKPLEKGYTDERFLAHQRAALERERATYVEQANILQAEAEQLVAEMEPGDIQFDEESGEGGTVAVDRERDLALSAQALEAVAEIDAALAKIANGKYGICENCGQLITKARLEALPYARLCIVCKSGGLSRR